MSVRKTKNDNITTKQQKTVTNATAVRCVRTKNRKVRVGAFVHNTYSFT